MDVLKKKYETNKEAYDINIIVDNVLNKKSGNINYNLSYSGGDIIRRISFSIFKPNLGPVASLSFFTANISNQNEKSIIEINVIYGLTALFQLYTSAIITLIVLLIAFYLYIKSDIDDFFLAPIATLSYGLFVYLIVESHRNSLLNSFKRLLKDNFVELKEVTNNTPS